jgi:hypothetical protein
MPRRRKKEGAEISLVPILSIQKCAMGIMVVIVCAQTFVGLAKTTDDYLQAEKAQEAVRAKKAEEEKKAEEDARKFQYLEIAGPAQGRTVVYVECQEQGILIHPEKTQVALKELQGGANTAFHQLLNELAKAKLANAKDTKYLVLLVRPEGITTYERCFQMAFRDRLLDVGKDAIPSGGDLVLTKDGQPLLAPKKGGR